MPCIYRILGLLINLIYWIVFGYINRIQIDKYSKQQILFKIYEELNDLEIRPPKVEKTKNIPQRDSP